MAASRWDSSARRSWYGVHCFIEARPSAAASANSRQVLYPQALQSQGRPLGPSPMVFNTCCTAAASATWRRGLISKTAPTLAVTPGSTTGELLRGGSVLCTTERRQ